MSEDKNKDLEPIIAVAGLGGTGANKGFWEVQLRDRLGQWAEMGRGLLNMVRLAVGLPAKPLRSVYIGASDKPGHFRGLVEGQEGYVDGVYHLPSDKSEVFEALIPEAVLKRQGLKTGPKLDSNGNPIISRKWTAQDTLDLSQIRIDPITDEDRRLATTTPTEQERQLIEKKRAESPLAKLPAGAEGKMSPDELEKLVETGPSVAVDTSRPLARGEDSFRGLQKPKLLRSDEVMAEAIKDAMDGKPVDLDEVIKLGAPSPVGKGGIGFEEEPEEEPAKVEPAAKKPAKKTPDAKVPAAVESDEELKPGKQETISPEELDALATPEEFEKYFGFLPSREQTRILAAIAKAKKNTAVRAGAGAGKTTTYLGLSKALMDIDPTARIALLQLNRTNADEAAKVVPANTVSNTVDAYFGRSHIVAMAQAKTGQQGGTANDPHTTRYMSESFYHIAGGERLGNHFLMDEMSIGGEQYDIGKVAALVQSAVDRFARGTDKKIGPQHFRLQTKVKKGETPEDIEIPEENLKKLVGYAQAYWDDLTHVPTWDERVSYKKKDGTTGLKFTKGVTAITPTHAFKMWALSNPDLSRLRSSDGKPITHIFLDEAQDTNAVFEKVLLDNLAKGTAPLIAMVGDRAQSIYKFRGSRDALTRFARDIAGADLTLTTTRRFGEDILPHANGFLNLLGEDYRLKSEVEGGEILLTDDISQIPDAKGTTAVQTRTNAEVFTQIEKFDQLGYTVGVTEKMYEDLTTATSHLEWLSQDFNSREKKPPAYSQDFAGMYSLKDLIKAAEIDPRSRAGYWWKLIQQDPEANIKKLKGLSEKVIVQRDQLEVEKVKNLDASSGNSGDFKGIKWNIDGDTIQISGTVFVKVPGRDDKNWRQIVVGQKAKKPGDPAYGPEVKLPDGTTPEWRAKKIGNDWITTLLIPSDADRSAYLSSIASLFEEDTKEPIIPDVLVSTAHRFKGLERDNIIIAPDFPQPELDEKGNLVMPGTDELNLAYTAVTRPRKRLYPGPLSYGLDYTGEDGMRKANNDLKRDPEFGLDIVAKERAAQEEITNKRKAKGTNEGGTALKSGKGQNFAGGFRFFEDEEDVVGGEETPGVLSTSPNTPGKELVKDWSILRNGTYSARIDGTTWNIRENRDGTIVARPRTNEDKLGSFKFNSWEQLANNFPDIQGKAIKANRDTLKEKIKPFDVNGEISKAIDNGADPEDIVGLISKTDEFSDAIENGDVNFVSIFAAVDNVGSNRLSRPNPKAAKPKTPKPKKAAPTVAQKSSDYFNKYSSQQMTSGTVVNLFDGSVLPFEEMLKIKTKSDVDEIIPKLLQFGGKINKDGSVTIFNNSFEEKAGPEKGKKVNLEIRWSGNKATSGTISYIITDPETGEKQEFWDYSPTHSFNKILTQTQRRLNTYWLRDPETLPSNQNPDTYGGIYGAINALRTGFTQTTSRKGAGGLARLLEDKKASDTNVKIRTPLEHITIAMNGRDTRLNNSLKNWATKQRKEVKSVFDALASNDNVAAIQALREYINNIPNTPAAQTAVRDYLTAAVKRQLPDVSPNKLNGMLDDIFDNIDSSDPLPVGAAIKPHLSKNNVLIEPGMKVRWTNNVGEQVVGQVRNLVGYDNPDGGRRTYADFVDVEFDGKDNAVRLNSKNMSVVDDATPLTGYANWVREDDLKAMRAEMRGWEYRPEEGKYYDGDSVVDVDEDLERDQDDYDITSDDTVQKSISSVEVGDILYDEEGNLYGKVRAIKRKTRTADKAKGYIVSFVEEDGQDDLFFTDDEQVNVPRPKTVEVAPKKEVTTSRADIAKAAAALNLAPGSDGSPSGKKIATNPKEDNPETNTAIKGSGKKAIKPTQEAEETLAEVERLGKEAWDIAESRIVDELNQAGYKIKPGTKYEDLDKAVDLDYKKSATAKDKSKSDLDTFFAQIKNSLTPAQLKSVQDKMQSDGLWDPNSGVDFTKLARELRSNGLEDFSYEIRGLGSDDADQLTGIAAYQVLSDPRNKSQAARLWKSYSAKLVDFNKAKKNKSEFSRALQTATKDATRKTAEDLGVSFDRVSLDEFNGRIVSVQDNQPLDALSTFKSARALRAAFDHMPSARIRQLAKYLEDNNVKLEIISGVKRGHFTRKSNGNLEITLSTAKGTRANDSTALHELQHFLDHVDRNGNVLAHAWLHKRASGPDGKLRPLMSWGNGETGFAITDLKSPYTTRRYERGEFVLDPNFDGNEVNSTIMEDLFLDAGSVSRPDGQYAIVKKTRPKINKKTKEPVIGPDGKPVMENYYDFVFDPYHDAQTDKWYTDDTKSEELDVRDFYGRKKSAGLDRNIKHYGLGMLLIMNDWSAVTGLGE